MTDMRAHTHRPLQQAPVKAMDPHGVTVVTTGLVLFALATAMCVWNLPFLEANGRVWWLGSCITGLSIGVLALVYLLARRRRHHDRAAAGEGQTPA